MKLIEAAMLISMAHLIVHYLAVNSIPARQLFSWFRHLDPWNFTDRTLRVKEQFYRMQLPLQADPH
jgi:hypothetical protein